MKLRTFINIIMRPC